MNQNQLILLFKNIYFRVRDFTRVESKNDKTSL